MHRTFLLALALLCFAAPVCADDEEAIKKYNEALSHWNDKDPSKAIAAAEAAFEAADSKNIQLNVLLMLGRIHSSKTGDSKAALANYDKIIDAVSISDRDRRYWGLKSSALLSKGNILVAENDDIAGGMKAFNASYDLVPTAANTNVLSQMILRISQEKGKEGSAVRADLLRALNYAKEAVSYQKNAKKKRPNIEAKYRVQLALVLTVLEKFETDSSAKERYGGEAATAWKAIDKEELDENASYELAQYYAVTGKDAEAVAKQVRVSMDLRPRPRARNLLRKWIRDEPFFQRFLKEKSWKAFVTDEESDS